MGMSEECLEQGPFVGVTVLARDNIRDHYQGRIEYRQAVAEQWPRPMAAFDLQPLLGGP